MSDSKKNNEVDDFEQNAKVEKLHLLFKQSFPAVVISLIVATLMLLILWQNTPHHILLIWFALLSISSLIRLVIFYKYQRSKSDGLSVLKWQWHYYISLLFSSLIWGIGCTVFLFYVPDKIQFVIYFFLMGLSSGAISVYSSIRPLVIAVVYSLLLPITVWFLMDGDKLHLYTGLGCCIFLMSGVRSTKVLSDTLHNNIILSLELLNAKKQAELLARKDFLTGLNNRLSFSYLSEQQIEYCLRHKLDISMIILDIDHFKKVNDTRGHLSGDKALKNIANVLLENIRKSDICGRIGGEEFAIVLPKTNISNAIRIAEKIRKAIESAVIEDDNGMFYITASIGISSTIGDLDNMMKQADDAMYQAKKLGRNKVVHINSLSAIS